jgi:hypothetical protein
MANRGGCRYTRQNHLALPGPSQTLAKRHWDVDNVAARLTIVVASHLKEERKDFSQMYM